MTTKIPIPTNPVELEEMLGDGTRMREVFADAGAFKEFVKNYAKTVQAKDADISAQVREQTQAALAEFMRSNGYKPENGAPKVDLTDHGMPQLSNLGGNAYQARRNRLYNKAAVAAPLDGKFGSLGDMLRVLARTSSGVNYLRDEAQLMDALQQVRDIQNSFGSNAPADGGFLIPESFRSDLLMLGLEDGVIRARATVIPMGTPRTSIPAVDSTSNATTVFGGIQTYWVDEGTAPPESSAKFSQVVLDAKKLMAYCTAPNELITDGVAFGAFIDAALPSALAFEEDYRFMQGNGVAQPLGYVGCPGCVTASAVSGQGAGTIVVDNLAAMFARMLPSSLSSAIWVASIDTFPQLALMSVAGTLGNSTPVWMNNGVVGAPPATIYGRPVYFTEKHPALGTAGDIMFVDPRFYLIGDRQSIEVSASPHFLFSSDKTAYKVIERVDGRPWVQSPITPKNGSSNTLSPYVQLSGTRT